MSITVAYGLVLLTCAARLMCAADVAECDVSPRDGRLAVKAENLVQIRKQDAASAGQQVCRSVFEVVCNEINATDATWEGLTKNFDECCKSLGHRDGLCGSLALEVFKDKSGRLNAGDLPMCKELECLASASSSWQIGRATQRSLLERAQARKTTQSRSTDTAVLAKPGKRYADPAPTPSQSEQGAVCKIFFRNCGLNDSLVAGIHTWDAMRKAFGHCCLSAGHGDVLCNSVGDEAFENKSGPIGDGDEQVCKELMYLASSHSEWADDQGLPLPASMLEADEVNVASLESSAQEKNSQPRRRGNHGGKNPWMCWDEPFHNCTKVEDCFEYTSGGKVMKHCTHHTQCDRGSKPECVRVFASECNVPHCRPQSLSGCFCDVPRRSTTTTSTTRTTSTTNTITHTCVDFSGSYASTSRTDIVVAQTGCSGVISWAQCQKLFDSAFHSVPCPPGEWEVSTGNGPDWYTVVDTDELINVGVHHYTYKVVDSVATIGNGLFTLEKSGTRGSYSIHFANETYTQKACSWQSVGRYDGDISHLVWAKVQCLVRGSKLCKAVVCGGHFSNEPCEPDGPDRRQIPPGLIDPRHSPVVYVPTSGCFLYATTITTTTTKKPCNDKQKRRLAKLKKRLDMLERKCGAKKKKKKQQKCKAKFTNTIETIKGKIEKMSKRCDPNNLSKRRKRRVLARRS